MDSRREAFGWGTVSYTHLDVYKRQHDATGTPVPRRLAALKGKARRFDLACEKAAMDSVVLDFLK